MYLIPILCILYVALGWIAYFNDQHGVSITLFLIVIVTSILTVTEIL